MVTLRRHFSSIKRYNDDVLCVNNDNFNKTHRQDLPIGINTAKHTTPLETSYLDTTINIRERNGTVRISVNDKREDFNLNFPYLESKIPRNPAYGVYIYLN